MKSNKEYRVNDKPKEKEFHDKFSEMFPSNTVVNKPLSAIVFGFKNGTVSLSNDYLNDREEDICLNIIKWLGSNVGKNFLNYCGFEEVEEKNMEEITPTVLHELGFIKVNLATTPGSEIMAYVKDEFYLRWRTNGLFQMNPYSSLNNIGIELNNVYELQQRFFSQTGRKL